MYVLLKQEVWWLQNLKGISCLFAVASQDLTKACLIFELSKSNI